MPRGHQLGVPLSEKHKMSLRKPHKISDEGMKKILDNFNKNPLYRAKRISEGLKGRSLSQEVRLKIGNALRKNKGGITPLHNLIRAMLKRSNYCWRKEIFSLNNYTCQKCGERGGRLHAHHIKPFANLLKEFLSEYSQFSPIEDKEILIKLAMNHKPFLEVDNGVTFCKECHIQIHSDSFFINDIGLFRNQKES